MWVRGLKHLPHQQHGGTRDVAPYVGAWIETAKSMMQMSCPSVAPYVGAWIETVGAVAVWVVLVVAPYVGAWIETQTATAWA